MGVCRSTLLCAALKTHHVLNHVVEVLRICLPAGMWAFGQRWLSRVPSCFRFQLQIFSVPGPVTFRLTPKSTYMSFPQSQCSLSSLRLNNCIHLSELGFKLAFETFRYYEPPDVIKYETTAF